MLSRDIERIMDKNEKFARMLEEYDRTGEFPLEKVRRSFTLKRISVKKLKEMSKSTGKSMSDILDELVDSCTGTGMGSNEKASRHSAGQ
jgi:hypothetical protein